MWKTAAFIACAVLAATTGRAQPAEGTADGDLALVKRAVEKQERTASVRPADDDRSQEPDADAVDRDAAPRTHRADKARWFRVRIEEKKGARVKVNLPLGFVRAVGDDLPLDWGCRRAHRGCKLTLSQVLDLLDGGQDLVEIKDADATVRIWVE